MIHFKFFVVMLTIVVILLLFLSSQETFVLGANTRQGHWKNLVEKQGEYLSIDVLGDPWRSSSIFGCVLACTNLYKDCKSVTFDALSGSCTPGGRVKTSNTQIFPKLKHPLFVSAGSSVCNTSLGFQTYTKNGVSACVRLSSDKKTQPQAVTECAKTGGNLYTVKSVEKLNILQLHFKISQIIWVGLKDVGKNGSFFWADGEYFDRKSSLWPAVWNSGQPNGPSWQFCVVFYPYGYKLNDLECYRTLQYLCEIV